MNEFRILCRHLRSSLGGLLAFQLGGLHCLRAVLSTSLRLRACLQLFLPVQLGLGSAARRLFGRSADRGLPPWPWGNGKQVFQAWHGHPEVTATPLPCNCRLRPAHLGNQVRDMPKAGGSQVLSLVYALVFPCLLLFGCLLVLQALLLGPCLMSWLMIGADPLVGPAECCPKPAMAGLDVQGHPG